MTIPISEAIPTLSVDERLERARPKQPIQSSAIGGGISSPGISHWLYRDPGWQEVVTPSAEKAKQVKK